VRLGEERRQFFFEKKYQKVLLEPGGAQEKGIELHFLP
jgi:hypothetical protein